MTKLQKDIILEICVITYNHKDFIERTLLSILNQKTSFNFRVLILDDCSTDGSSKTIKSIADSNPDKIDYHLNKKNIGPLQSALKLSKLVSAKYICFLDGDDYWNYENKIQYQLEFLENNPDYTGCFNDAVIEQKNISTNTHYLHRTQVHWKTYSQFNRYTSDFMPWDLVKRNIIPTSSLIFRNKDLSTFLINYKHSELSLSWALHLEIIKESKFKYFNEPWSVYVDHSDGISKKHDIIDFKLNNVKILEGLLEDNKWIFYKSDIIMTICSEIRLWLQSESQQKKGQKEFDKLIKKYKYYQKLFLRTDISYLKEEANRIRNSNS